MTDSWSYYRTRTLNIEDDFWHRPLAWLSWVRLEIDNITLALQKCLDASDWRRGLDIAIATAPYWSTLGTRDSRRWFDQLMRRSR